MMRHETNDGIRSQAATTDQSSAQVTLKQAVTRLLQLLERETTALRHRQPVDMDELCHRKNQPCSKSAGSAAGSRATRRQLDENQSVLKIHLQAVGEVADILAAAIHDAESDGTYSTGASSRWLA